MTCHLRKCRAAIYIAHNGNASAATGIRLTVRARAGGRGGVAKSEFMRGYFCTMPRGGRPRPPPFPCLPAGLLKWLPVTSRNGPQSADGDTGFCLEKNRSVDGDTRTCLESDDGCSLNEAEARNLSPESQQIKQFSTGS